MIRTLLVANRGEIARRIFRTCRALGIRTAAVYTDADAGLPYVAEADVAVRIGEGPASSSYLDVARLLDAAGRVGADAIHPGYGFLSENAGFAQAVVQAGLVWIGPPPEAIRAMGDKARARQAVARHGVPVLPGYDEEDQSDEVLSAAADRVGYPVLVKATAGGGGRGLRRVDDPASLPEALASARREAGVSFGDSRVLLERFVTRPRHIEIQVFGDSHGAVVHLGERECSIQRRHQKVVEEAPSPGVTPALRETMGQAACEAARAVGYTGAGTVEFLLDPDGNFYFLEMNTRLQVEHPVTELVTGEDLVAWQIVVAEGGHLPKQQSAIVLTGHAIEVRLYAEDPLRDWMPATGRMLRLDLPAAEGIRVDAGYGDGSSVSPHYDAMVAKIIASGPSRASATRRLRRALAEAWMPGIANNLPLLRQILDHELWRTENLDTDFLNRASLPARPPENRARGVLAAVVAGWASRPSTPSVPRGFRLDGPAWSSDRYTSFGVSLTARWRTLSADRLEVEVEGGAESLRVEVQVHPGQTPNLPVTVNGVREVWRVTTAAGPDGVSGGPPTDGSTVYVHLGDGQEAMVTLEPRHPPPAAKTATPGAAMAPTPGTVVRVAVAAGDAVVAGQVLVVLEAMKMEHNVRAPADGEVAAVWVTPGDVVREGALLAQITAWPGENGEAAERGRAEVPGGE